MLFILLSPPQPSEVPRMCTAGTETAADQEALPHVRQHWAINCAYTVSGTEQVSDKTWLSWIDSSRKYSQCSRKSDIKWCCRLPRLRVKGAEMKCGWSFSVSLLRLRHKRRVWSDPAYDLWYQNWALQCLFRPQTKLNPFLSKRILKGSCPQDYVQSSQLCTSEVIN